MLTGVGVAIGTKFSVSTFWKDCFDSKATMIVYVGETARYLLVAPPSDYDRAHRVRSAWGNGMRPDVWERFRKRFGISQIHDTEGMLVLDNKSTGLYSAFCVGHHGALMRRRLRNVYVPVKIDPDTGDIWRDPVSGFAKRTSYDEGGEILVAIPDEKAFSGYWKNAEATAKKLIYVVFRRGDIFYRSGDALRRDSDGHWYFLDRLGDTFRWKSENVSTAEVGAVLGNFPGVLESNVYGVCVPGYEGRAGCAALLLEPTPQNPFDFKAFAKHARKNLPKYAVPIFLRILSPTESDSMHTSNNKQNKVPLREEGIDRTKIGTKITPGHHHRLMWLPPNANTYVDFGQKAWDELNKGLQQQQQQQQHTYPATRGTSYNNAPRIYGDANDLAYAHYEGNAYGEAAQRSAMGEFCILLHSLPEVRTAQAICDAYATENDAWEMMDSLMEGKNTADMNGHGTLLPPPSTQQQKQARQQPQLQLRKPPYSHAQQNYFLPHVSSTQQHATPTPTGPPMRGSTDLAERMNNLQLTEDLRPYDDRIAQQLPSGPMPPDPVQVPMGGHGYVPASASTRTDCSQQHYEQNQSSRSYSYQHSAPTPALAPTPPPMVEGRPSRVAMVRRSVTAPLPPLETDMENPPDVPPMPFTTACPQRAPAYPGQRVYSSVTREHPEQQKYQVISPPRPPKLPTNTSSPTQSLNVSLVGSAGESGSPTAPAYPRDDEDVHRAEREGTRHLSNSHQQEFAPLDASQNNDVQEYYGTGSEAYVGYGRHEATATELPPRTTLKAPDNLDMPSLASHPTANMPPVSSATSSSQHTTSTTSSTPDDQRRHTSDFKHGSAPRPAPTSSNPTTTTNNYVAYKPYSPSETPSGPEPSSTPSPTLPTLPDSTGGTGATSASPYASITPPKAYLPREHPQAPTSTAVQVTQRPAQSSPIKWQFAENEVRNGRSGTPGAFLPVEPGPEYTSRSYMPLNISESGRFSVPPPPIRHIPTAPADAFREGSGNSGRPPSLPYSSATPAAAAVGRHMPGSGPDMFPTGRPQCIPAGGPTAQTIPYPGRSATMTSMTPPAFDRHAMTGTPGPTPLYPPGQVQTAQIPKPVPYRPGLEQLAPATTRQYGPTSSQGPSQVQPGVAGASNSDRSATMTSMVSVPGSIPPASMPSGPVAQLSGATAGSRNSQTAKSSPLTMEELRRCQNMAKANANDDRIQFDYAKKLLEASRTLVAASAGNPKQMMKQKQAYVGEGLKILRKCAHREYPDALFYLADGYGQGLWGLSKDPKEAFPLYVSAAKAGHGPSAYRTAVCCEMGADAGTRRDLLKAVQWYRRAASLGDTPAMYKMGMIQLKGLLGQPRSPHDAITWLKRAAEHADEENPHALHELALLYENPGKANDIITKDEKYALELLEKAGDLGYKYSQYKLGVIFEHGLLGFQPDPRQSILWYSRAAAQGEHNSELSLSGWYLTGAEGVLQQSDTEAYLWARKAAMAGLAKAEYAMGYFTEVGIGVPSNLEQAKRWYWKASSQNFVKARERLEDLKRGGAMMEKSKLSREPQHRNDTDCVLM
ncbi:hypothetical protein KEM54_003404 [Ascosphaera aggregata]|nr:hypothetical protein KEM54_003404 [Ascosphaera aggregata]